MLIDTHAHLDYPDYADDLPAVVARATEQGVTQIVTVGTDLESAARALAIADAYPGVFAAVGIHPNEVKVDGPEFVDGLRRLAAHPKVVAIGETGLDYHYLPSRREKEDLVRSALGSASIGSVELEIRDEALKAAQAVAFEQQLELAAELGKNVIIHQRDAWSDTLAILERHRVQGVFHCFNGSLAQAEELISLGHLVSFTGLVTFRSGAEVRAAAARLPLDRIMVETDAPYLAPVPHRGKRCEPAFVRHTATSLAQARNVRLEEFAEETTETARRFFELP